MRRSDSQKDSKTAEAGPPGDPASSSPQRPEIPDISAFDSLQDDGEEWYQDGDPTQEVEDDDIVAEELVLVGEDGQPLPEPDGTPRRDPVADDLPVAPRAARLPPPMVPRGKATPEPAQTPAPAAAPVTEKPVKKQTAEQAAAKQAVLQAAATMKETKKETKKAAKQAAKKATKKAAKQATKSAATSKPAAKQARAPVADKKPAAKPAAVSPVPTAGAPSHLEEGLALREQGQPQRAIEALNRALKQGSPKVRCHTLIGLCYMELGIAARAISAFKNALFQEDVTDEETTALRYELGRAHERQEEWEEALYYHRRVVKADPIFRDAAIRIGAIERRMDGN